MAVFMTKCSQWHGAAGRRSAEPLAPSKPLRVLIDAFVNTSTMSICTVACCRSASVLNTARTKPGTSATKTVSKRAVAALGTGERSVALLTCHAVKSPRPIAMPKINPNDKRTTLTRPPYSMRIGQWRPPNGQARSSRRHASRRAKARPRISGKCQRKRNIPDEVCIPDAAFRCYGRAAAGRYRCQPSRSHRPSRAKQSGLM